MAAAANIFGYLDDLIEAKRRIYGGVRDLLNARNMGSFHGVFGERIMCSRNCTFVLSGSCVARRNALQRESAEFISSCLKGQPRNTTMIAMCRYQKRHMPSSFSIFSSSSLSMYLFASPKFSQKAIMSCKKRERERAHDVVEKQASWHYYNQTLIPFPFKFDSSPMINIRECSSTDH